MTQKYFLVWSDDKLDSFLELCDLCQVTRCKREESLNDFVTVLAGVVEVVRLMVDFKVELTNLETLRLSLVIMNLL